MKNTLQSLTLFLVIAVLHAGSALGQETSLKDTANPADVASPEAIVKAAYKAIARAPGERIQWDRFHSLFLPEARLISNPEQRGGLFDVMTPHDFTDWIDEVTVVGGPDDRGFVETDVNNIVEQYGDVAHVFSTYKKHFWGEDQSLGGGINSFQLVHHDGRWWIVGIVWDEPSGAGPIPEKYLK